MENISEKKKKKVYFALKILLFTEWPLYLLECDKRTVSKTS